MLSEEEKKQKKGEVKDKQEDLKRYALLEAVANSEGGKFLISGFQDEVGSALDKIRTLYKTASQEELRAWCAILDSRITLLRSFNRAPNNRKLTGEEINELLKAIDAENE